MLTDVHQILAISANVLSVKDCWHCWTISTSLLVELSIISFMQRKVAACWLQTGSECDLCRRCLACGLAGASLGMLNQCFHRSIAESDKHCPLCSFNETYSEGSKLLACTYNAYAYMHFQRQFISARHWLTDKRVWPNATVAVEVPSQLIKMDKNSLQTLLACSISLRSHKEHNRHVLQK